MSLLSSAYLDDYQRITLHISKKYHNGKSGIFCLRYGKQLNYLLVEDEWDCGDYVCYSLKCDELDLSKSYEVVIRENYSCHLQIRYIVKTNRFNQEYYYEGNDLGSTYSQKGTVFKVWAPTATSLYLEIDGKLIEMKRGDHGVYAVTIEKDCLNQAYRYLVCFGEQCTYTTDPYAKASLPNSGKSVVCKLPAVSKSNLKKLPYDRNALIMEGNVADLSKEGTFEALKSKVEEIRNLGFTHLQLMPISDFGSVDDYHKNAFYNWGYDPMQYQVLQGSYSADCTDPTLVISEFGTLVEAAHNSGLKIVLDMVFNHHYSVERSSFNRLVPYYFFRYQNDELCEGTYCGNEFDTQQLMCRKYFMDTLLFYITQYDVDGFRFDLMNFIDLDTMNQIKDACRKAKEDIILYGEGWKMAAGISIEQLSTMDNASKLAGIGFFNDRFRDTLRGNNYDCKEKGYGNGNLLKSVEMASLMEGKMFTDVNQGVNYVECHDNRTLFDLLSVDNPCELDVALNRRVILINGCVLFSNGIRMIHAGQEFGLSKNGLDNTYNGTPEINNLTNKKINHEIFDGFKTLCDIHKNYIAHDELISYRDDWGVLIGESRKLYIIINPSDHVYTFNCDKGHLIFDGKERVRRGIEKQILIDPISFVVIEK